VLTFCDRDRKRDLKKKENEKERKENHIRTEVLLDIT
jgi:hypothetical protein